ncbi:MAG: Crp/Fnr family transcriptional regulator [Dysgonomonas sp.]
MNIENLSQSYLFGSIDQNDLLQLFSKIEIKESDFEKGDILAQQDEPCNRLIILTQGSVKAEMTDPSGKVVKVEDIHAPNPLAILFLFGKKNKFPVQVSALEKTSALIIPRHSVLKMLSMNEQLLKNYLDISANFAAQLSSKLFLMSFRTIRQKLAMYLLDLSNNSDKNTVELDRSQTALAEYFGVSRPSLTRELSNMVKDNLISMDKKQIRLENKNKLFQMVQFS